MAEIKVPHEDFTLRSSWTCRTTYYYNSSGSFNSSTNSTSGLTTAKSTVRFGVDLPAGAEIRSARVHAAHTGGWSGGKFRIDGTAPVDDFVTLAAPDVSDGYIDVLFEWTATPEGSSAHRNEYPSYNGSSSQSKTYDHWSVAEVSDVYLLIDYGQGGVIYRAEGGKLVPYQLYRAEGGKLVPYQLYRAEGGKLVPY